MNGVSIELFEDTSFMSILWKVIELGQLTTHTQIREYLPGHHYLVTR
jgi:hypothetical protein